MSERNGLIYDILQDSHRDGPGSRTTVLFKGCSLDCWWCASPEAQSPAVEVMFWKSRCVRCGTCVTLCSMDAARADEVPAVVAEGAAASGAEYSGAEYSGAEGGDTEAGASGYHIEREACIVCGSCVEKCQGEARELVGQRVTAAEVMAQLDDSPAADGVTFGGGEPLMQSAFLGDLLSLCKARGLHTAVDTSGYAPWEVIERVRGDVDLFLFELKLMDDERHRRFTGVSNEVILHNLKTLSAHGQRIILRVPVIPGFTDDAENLSAIAQFAAGLPHLEGVELLPYRQTAKDRYERLGRPFRVEDPCAAAEAELEEAVRLFREQGLNARIVC